MDAFKNAFTKNVYFLIIYIVNSTKFTPAIRAITKNAKSTINNIKTQMQEKKLDYQETNFWSELVEITPRVYYIPFPTENKINVMSSFLNKTFGANYYIWNISEHKYDISKFNNQA